MDAMTIAGFLLCISVVLGGQWMVGGSPLQLWEWAALWIVLGGTFSSLLLSFTAAELKITWRSIPTIFKRSPFSSLILMQEINGIAAQARKEGLLSIEAQRLTLKNHLLKKNVKYITDGLEIGAVRELLDAEIHLRQKDFLIPSLVMEAAASTAPALGIVGAVMGLIQVMLKLDDPSRMGVGIAIAFLCVIYGLLFANLFFQPGSIKLKKLASLKMIELEMIRVGVLGILEGLSPGFIQEKLKVLGQDS
jgi:chemotaxis protein MotA